MDKAKDQIKKLHKHIYLYMFHVCFAAFFGFGLLSCPAAFAQEKQLIQVKTFDARLQPYKNISISINEKGYISMGARGVALVELEENDLPVASIQVKEQELEAGSWNYSRGILEVIIRKKNYKIYSLSFKDVADQPLPDTEVTFNGKNPVTAKTNSEGRVELILPLNESVNSPSQFSIDGYTMSQMQTSEKQISLTAEEIIDTLVAAEVTKFETLALQPDSQTAPDVPEEFFRNFDISMLDSIQSLTVFYAVFKNYNIEDLDDDIKQQVDNKFNELVGRLQNPESVTKITFLNNISDTTYVRDDIDNLLSQAGIESQMLTMQQADFDEKIQLIDEKLSVGFENLDADARDALLRDLTKLENLLAENESRFFRNQNSYRNVINTLKDRFFNLEDLENKLTVSEAQRLEEQRIFRQRLMITLSVATVFAIMIILLIYFHNKLEKQKRKLELANSEISRINENLEGIVFERTKMLEATNKELDTVLYRASHDLRSPVCSIIGLCNIATATTTDKESILLLEKVVQTTSDMDRLLKKLSVISEINNPSNLAIINLNEVMKGLQKNYNKLIKKHKVNFIIECPDDLVINSYPYLIEVILSNLIENAFFFCLVKESKDYEVKLSADMNDEHLELSLSDNGIGIESAISDKLFDMFFRGNEYSKGNGLGLYIVKKSVHALNGHITVESDPGNFTKFIVQLPLEIVQPEVQRAMLVE